MSGMFALDIGPDDLFYANPMIVVPDSPIITRADFANDTSEDWAMIYSGATYPNALAMGIPSGISIDQSSGIAYSSIRW